MSTPPPPTSPTPLMNITDISNISLKSMRNVNETILEKQNQMNTIVDEEMKRLETKKHNMSDMVDSKERMIQLNTNIIERKQEFQKMTIALIIGLAICIIVYTVNKTVPIPSVISSLILIITFAGVFIYCFNVYFGMIQRDRMDFEKIYLKPPVIQEKDLGQSKAVTNGDLLDYLTAGLCFGSSCCSDQTVWDSSMSLCIDKPTVATTDPSAARVTTDPSGGVTSEHFDTLLKVNANSFKVVHQTTSSPRFFSPYEFDSYSVYLGK
jgi:hypothetical protein